MNEILKNGAGLFMGIAVVLMLLAGSASAIPAPTGVAGIVTGPGHSSASVIVVATSPNSNERLSSFVTATDSNGRFAGAISTDMEATMDLHVSIVSGEKRIDKTIKNLHAGDDQLLMFNLSSLPVDESAGQNSNNNREAGSGGGFPGGMPLSYNPAEENDSLPPLDKEWASKIVDENNEKNTLSSDEIAELNRIIGNKVKPSLLRPSKIRESMIVYFVSLLMTIVILLVVIVLEVHKNIYQSRCDRGADKRKKRF